jgi:hypothetical protein
VAGLRTTSTAPSPATSAPSIHMAVLTAEG